MKKLIKGLLLSCILLFSMTGCIIDEDSSHKDSALTGAQIKELRDIDVTINYHNYDDDIYKNESIYFIYNHQTAYHSVNIKSDGKVDTIIKSLQTDVRSHCLGKTLSLPEAGEGEMIVIDIDYEAKTIDAHCEPQNTSKNGKGE